LGTSSGFAVKARIISCRGLIESRQVVNTQEVLSITDRSRMLTQDAALVDINIAVQYRRADPRAFVFNIVDPQATLAEASESAIREIIGQTQS
jgi:membrane protease subunit HflK